MSIVEPVSAGRGASALHVREGGWWPVVVMSGAGCGEFYLVSRQIYRMGLAALEAPYERWVPTPSIVARFAISIGVAAIILGGPRLIAQSRAIISELERRGWPWMLIFANAASLGLLLQLSALMFDGAFESRAYPAAWLGGWILALLGVIGFGLAAVWQAMGGKLFRDLGTEIGAIGGLVAIAAVIAGQLSLYSWRPMCQATFRVVEGLLRPFYPSVVAKSSELVIATEAVSVEIAPRCSGVEGIGLMIVLMSAFFWLFRHELRFPRVLLLLPAALIAIWLANTVRIAVLIALATSISPEVAQRGFHSQAGWIAYCAIGLGFMAIARRTPCLLQANFASEESTQTGRNAAACFLVPILTLLTTSMIGNAFSRSDLNVFYPLQVILTSAVLWHYRSDYRRLARATSSRGWRLLPVLLGTIVFAIWYWLAMRKVHPQQNESIRLALTELPTSLAVVWIVFRAAGSVVLAPVVEELAFRGFLTRRLMSSDFQSIRLGAFTVFSFIASSISFGLLHDQWLAGSIAGALFAVALYYRRSLTDAIIAHATANALVTGYVLYNGNLAAWS